MVENLPEKVKVGVIVVAVGGCKIELFDRDNHVDYVATAPGWMKVCWLNTEAILTGGWSIWPGWRRKMASSKASCSTRANPYQ